MIQFTNEELERIKILADSLCQVVELEHDEVKIMNKFYKWIDEQQILEMERQP